MVIFGGVSLSFGVLMETLMGALQVGVVQWVVVGRHEVRWQETSLCFRLRAQNDKILTLKNAFREMVIFGVFL